MNIQDIKFDMFEQDIKFAKLNKNETLGEYKDECSRGEYNISRVKIERLVFATAEEFAELSNSFLTDNEIYQSGGTWLDSDTIEELGLSDEDIQYFRMSKDQKAKLLQTSALVCTKVIHEESGECFYVDTQGYRYARYVGIK